MLRRKANQHTSNFSNNPITLLQYSRYSFFVNTGLSKLFGRILCSSAVSNTLPIASKSRVFTESMYVRRERMYADGARGLEKKMLGDWPGLKPGEEAAVEEPE